MLFAVAAARRALSQRVVRVHQAEPPDPAISQPEDGEP